LIVTDSRGGKGTSVLENLVVDTEPPVIECPDAITVLLGSDPLDQEITSFLSAVVAKDSVDEDVDISNSELPDFTLPGSYPIVFHAADESGNSSSCASAITVKYGFSGLLPPIKDGGMVRPGRVVPVKFQLTDATGGYIKTANAEIVMQRTSAVVPRVYRKKGSNSRDSELQGTFRYDPINNVYIYMLRTRRLLPGVWKIQVILDDGNAYDTNVIIGK
jgi:hypothetical protein